MKPERLDLAFGVAIVVLALVTIYLFIPAGVVPSQGPRALSPRFWPTLVAWFLAFAGAVVVAGAFLRATRAEGARDAEAEARDGRAPAILRGLAAVAGMYAFYFLLPHLGMLLASILFVILSSTLLGARNWVAVLSVGIGIPLVLYLFFTRVAATPLPKGVLAGWI